VEELLTIKRVLDFKKFMHHDSSMVFSVYVVIDIETSTVMMAMSVASLYMKVSAFK
jgi:hypothetical protein